ncbi:MAG: sortase [Pseudomonadota bacterium]
MVSFTIWRLTVGALITGSVLWLLNSGGTYQLQSWLLETAWSRTISGERKVEPWPWADTWPVARLWMPEREARYVVLAGANQETLSVGIGHSIHSAYPGDIGNAILSVPAMPQFEPMLMLKNGQRLVLELPYKGRWHYEIQAMYRVDKTDTRLLLPSLERRLTLVVAQNELTDERHIIVANAVRQTANDVISEPTVSFGMPALK